jgi:hypothetical protein
VATGFDPQRDVDLMRKVMRMEIGLMNADNRRFTHPIKALGGLWGNTLHKWQKTGRFSDAPFGALFNRLYNEDGKYKNVQECYGQAEVVLRSLRRWRGAMSGRWELGMAEQPGHYWACARAELSQMESAPVRVGGEIVAGGTGRFLFVHMDPWKDEFDVTVGVAGSVRWTPTPG